MKQFEYVVQDSMGLHARPAGQLAKKTKQYKSKVFLECKKGKVDCQRMLAMMQMQIKCGDEITFYIDGEDEEFAAKDLQSFCEENM